jgi:hypothetical protein
LFQKSQPTPGRSALPQENYAGAARKKSRLFPYRPTTALAYGIYSTALYEWPYCDDSSSMFDILLICAAFSRLPIDPNMHLPQCLNAWMPFLNTDVMDKGGDATFAWEQFILELDVDYRGHNLRTRTIGCT